MFGMFDPLRPSTDRSHVAKMSPKGRDHNPSGLGRAIINRKVQDARNMHESGLYTTDVDSSTKLKSVTQERDLDEFLNTAELAGVQFAAERRDVKIIPQNVAPSQNPYLLGEVEEKATIQKQDANRSRLRVPRRPPWRKDMAVPQLDKQEKAAFLNWRRGLAELQDLDQFLLTPFERNIEVWRQLWRVLERSHLIVQIVDARNPLRFWCEDLDAYVQDVEGPEGEQGTGKGIRRSLLLINKSDLLTSAQRRAWAGYFDSKGIQYAFYSATNATTLQESQRDAGAHQRLQITQRTDSQSEDEGRGGRAGKFQAEPPSSTIESDASEEEGSVDGESDGDSENFSGDENVESEQDQHSRVLSVQELQELFLRAVPDLRAFVDASGKVPDKLIVGLVGYPNVGKSSTINSLLGEKKVSVSSTPGKTKHFQTINLSDKIMLCDCPGLVFPQFATTKADLVCDGVLPIDQLKEYTGPISLVVRRVPQEVLEATYGLTLKTTSAEEGDRMMGAEHLLIPYAIAKGYVRSGQGNPDEARSARYILKDYVNGKLLYCHPPPGIAEETFNKSVHQRALRRMAGRKRAPATRVGKDADTFVAPHDPNAPDGGEPAKSRAVDRDFFGSELNDRPVVNGRRAKNTAFARARFYPHQNAVADDGTAVGARAARIASVLSSAGSGSKKHFKQKRGKHRSGAGYD
ncbi:P-loop containing nucleoside triphosphate hydrolase protein [Fistulina hepatica ATCC 64428]|uniref:p-loop containing nucleoside triphosphate hydrolase protein n=1 Tax=Fistulina hepatica ATCC 64428 TaxID=1128425 RepID=A0A0D7A7D1_9AGAR|nr:P-loop containing nucleoside triphosphate hydrolase protein [Fistulina hepatica ATCC 64428]